jgi:two-component system, cell cycle response regulator DivK
MGVGLPPPLQKTVLVVEDNYLNRRLLEVRLELHGYGSVTTTSGAAAIDIAREQDPDLILMDIQLPDISGVEVIRRLKADEQTRSIPIIAVTAFVMPAERTNILASGCDAYVAKPFKGDELVALIDYYTRRHSAPGSNTTRFVA